MWREIPGYNGHYLIDESGNCKSVERLVQCKDGHYQKVPERILKPQLNKLCGYYEYGFCVDKIKSSEFIHRLVAKTFIPNPDNLPVVNHKNGNKFNNHVSNLEWCTYSHNSKHAIDTGLIDKEKMIDSLRRGWNLVLEKSDGIRCIDDDKEFINKHAAADYYNADKDAILESIIWCRPYYKLGKRFEYVDKDKQQSVVERFANFDYNIQMKNPVREMTTGQIFKNRTQAAQFYGVDKGVIDRSLLFNQPTSQGIQFEWTS